MRNLSQETLFQDTVPSQWFWNYYSKSKKLHNAVNSHLIPNGGCKCNGIRQRCRDAATLPGVHLQAGAARWQVKTTSGKTKTQLVLSRSIKLDFMSQQHPKKKYVCVFFPAAIRHCKKVNMTMQWFLLLTTQSYSVWTLREKFKQLEEKHIGPLVAILVGVSGRFRFICLSAAAEFLFSWMYPPLIVVDVPRRDWDQSRRVKEAAPFFSLCCNYAVCFSRMTFFSHF